MRKGFVLMVAKWTFNGERGSQSTQNSPSSLFSVFRFDLT